MIALIRYHFILIVFGIVLSYCTGAAGSGDLRVTREKIALRSEPGVNGSTLKWLQKGDAVKDLGAVSRFESHISFDGVEWQRPWIKVETPEGKQGWIFAGALRPAGDTASWLLQKRLLCYFDAEVAARLNAWQSEPAIRDETQMAARFEAALRLRDTLMQLLAHRAEPEDRPDYSWLGEGVLPGFIYQRVEPGGVPALFADYRYWMTQAQSSTGTADDVFFQMCAAVFPHDSIESPFPLWTFQYSESGGASRLGSGAHLNMLRLIDRTLAVSPLFRAELMRFKDRILDDIQDKNTQFWLSKDQILGELDALIANPPACLNDREKAALLPRRVMLSEPERHGIRVNMRSGE